MTIIRPVRWELRDNPEHRRFVAERLIALKAGLQEQVHAATSEHSLRLATWNIMHFGDGGAYDRSTESMLYIAEIIDHFDLVAVQEVNENIDRLEELIAKYLGSGWDYLVTDVVEGSAGNNERLAFLYRTGKVQFCREVGEIVLPTGDEIAAPGADGSNAVLQFARTPFSVSFRAGWLRFKLCTVHIHYGKDQSQGSPDMVRRREEIAKVAGLLAKRQEHERLAGEKRAAVWADPKEGGWNANYILLGDFNIVSPEHETMRALTDAGFTVQDKDHADIAGSGKHYDQIAHKTGHPGFKAHDSGVFDMFGYVYRDEDAGHYVDRARLEVLSARKDPKPGQPPQRTRNEAMAYFRSYYRKHQMSDHKLLWAELCIDYANDYLERIIDEPTI
ncbi:MULTISPECIES: endonuclease/exonuclease/phosphatase family protein [unclassified Novosphingobium]|uniref:endonuclease/exonuclease/phosphatase family protein n=1 Tax=unclassified Novosphingobium TaxID=2644732 RepID=UPI001358D217|nr:MULTISPECIES: endonuclease/exonuclease/phosphatase family protein [unclassified Novosphingobium]